MCLCKNKFNNYPACQDVDDMSDGSGACKEDCRQGGYCTKDKGIGSCECKYGGEWKDLCCSKDQCDLRFETCDQEALHFFLVLEFVYGLEPFIFLSACIENLIRRSLVSIIVSKSKFNAYKFEHSFMLTNECFPYGLYYYFVSPLLNYSNFLFFPYSINFVSIRRPHQYCNKKSKLVTCVIYII